MKRVSSKVWRPFILALALIVALTSQAWAAPVNFVDETEKQETEQKQEEKQEEAPADEPAATTSTTTAGTRSLSLQEALSLCLTNNENIILADKAVDAAKITVDQTASAVKKTNDSIDDYNLPVTQDLNAVINIAPKQAEEAYNFALISREYTANSLRYGVETAYYSLQKAEKALEVARASMKRAETQYKNTQAQEEQGLVSNMDVVRAESAYLGSQTAYEQTRVGVLAARMALNKMLGLDLNTVLKLKDPITLVQGENVNIAQAIEAAKKIDVSYNSAKMSHRLKQLDLEEVDGYYRENTYVYKQAVVEEEKAKLSLEEAEKTLEMNVRNAYNSLTTSAMNYQSLVKSRDQAKEALRLAELRYKAGLSTIYDVQSADAAFQQAEMELLDAINTYNLAHSAFAYSIFGGGM